MSTTETPRDADGAKLCAWCGGPVQQTGVGRSRDYCSRTHREYAYRDRKTREKLQRAYFKGRAEEREAARRTVSSTDESPHASVSSTDETRSPAVSSVDEIKPQVRPVPAPAKPVAPNPGTSRAKGRRLSWQEVLPHLAAAEDD